MHQSWKERKGPLPPVQTEELEKSPSGKRKISSLVSVSFPPNHSFLEGVSMVKVKGLRFGALKSLCSTKSWAGAGEHDATGELPCKGK